MRAIHLDQFQKGSALMITALVFMLICGLIVYSNFKVSKSIVFDSYNQLAKTETFHAAQAATNIVMDSINSKTTAVGIGSSKNYYEIMMEAWDDTSQTLIYQVKERSIETKVYIRFVKEVFDSSGDLDSSNSNPAKGLFELIAISKTDDNRNATTKLVVGIMTD